MNKYHTNRKRGAAIITAVIFFVIIATTMAIGLSSPVVREYTTARDFAKSKGAYYLSEAGSEDAIYRIKKAKPISVPEVIFLGGNTATTTIITVSANQKDVSSLGDILANTRRVKSTMTTSSSESFNFGVQAGDGGVDLDQSSTITGNIFSSGPVTGSNNLVTGTVISGGSTGLNGSISGIFNQGGSSMYAGTITNSIIAGSAYCNTISGSTPNTCQTLTAQIAQPFPITAQDIANYETAAVAGGTVTCSGGKYAINDSVNIGPKKIPCDLEITGSGSEGGPVITLGGPIWVTGNITLKNHLTVRVDPTLVDQSIVMVADNPSNHSTGSTVDIQGSNVVFAGAPGGKSWVMLISENTSASQSGSTDAIQILQGAQGDVLVYARLGNIRLEQNASVKEVTAYKITLRNTANVIYQSGLQNALFTSGPGGTWTIQDWKEAQ